MNKDGKKNAELKLMFTLSLLEIIVVCFGLFMIVKQLAWCAVLTSLDGGK